MPKELFPPRTKGTGETWLFLGEMLWNMEADKLAVESSIDSFRGIKPNACVFVYSQRLPRPAIVIANKVYDYYRYCMAWRLSSYASSKHNVQIMDVGGYHSSSRPSKAKRLSSNLDRVLSQHRDTRARGNDISSLNRHYVPYYSTLNAVSDV